MLVEEARGTCLLQRCKYGWKRHEVHIYVKLNYVEQCVSNRNEVKNEVHMG